MSRARKSLDSIKGYVDGARIDAFFRKRSRKQLELGVCYKLLTANSGSNFRSGLTINGCGEILKWNDENKRSASLVR
jgi:hypothetical protein